MFRRIKSGWQLTRKSWGVLRSEPNLIRFPIVGGLISLAIAVVFLAPGAYFLDGDPAALGVVLIAIGAYLIAFAGYYFSVGLAANADRHMRGEEISFGTGMKVASSRMSAIAGWAFVATVVMTIIRAIQERFGVAGAIFGALAAVGWALITFLAVPVIAFEGTGPFATIKRCSHLLKSRWGEQITGNIAIGGAVFFIGILPAVIFISGGILLWATSGVGGGILIGIGAVVLIVAMLVQQSLSTIFGVALYRYAAAGEAVGSFTQEEVESAVRVKKGRGGATPSAGTI
ncbi:MAG: hypothetical protein JJE10_04370 [Thermoleophilia bacterium]|nr:hypothetical protein [Thermoleophilia bacterium]